MLYWEINKKKLKFKQFFVSNVAIVAFTCLMNLIKILNQHPIASVRLLDEAPAATQFHLLITDRIKQPRYVIKSGSASSA